MTEYIKSRLDLCTGCNRCVRECPMETANITYQDENGNIKVRIDQEKCIECGRCINMCKHGARVFEDDTERFFRDLSNGIPISLIAAPAVQTNIPEYKRLFTYLKNAGINKIYDVSLGADISIWAHVRHIEKNGSSPMITQPCPVIVSYCEIYRHELIDNLSPIHSPMACVSIYMKEYEGITDSIAALSPCIAKSVEFEDTGLAQYNVTFAGLQRYFEENGVELPEEESGFDHGESGMGALFPMPGGLKENLDFYFDKKIHVYESEGFGVFKKLDIYSETPKEVLPEVFDVLNCGEGCNIGSAVASKRNIYGINAAMQENRNDKEDAARLEWLEGVYRTYDEKLDLSLFMRSYRKIETPFQEINDADIEKAFELLGKDDYEKQHVDCSACGSITCYGMARKIALGVNIPNNCMVRVMEIARQEHEQNLASQAELAKMEKLREADERIRIILDSNPHINILFSSKFEVLDCNPAALKFMGVETKQELTTGFMEFITKSIPKHQSDGRKSIPLNERFMVVQKEGSVGFETDLVIDGKTRTLDVNFKKIPYADGFAIVGYLYDMTTIHEREMELKRVKENSDLQLAKLNMAVAATRIALWDMETVSDDPLDPNNKILWTSEFRRMLGFEDENDFPNIISSWRDKLHPEDSDRSIDAFLAHLLDTTGNTPFDVEYRLKKKSGEYGYYRAMGETLRNENGMPIRVVGTLMDITETKNILLETQRRRIEAEAANRAKSAFLSTMSHEIRTPMNAILGITEIQLQNEEMDEAMRDALGKIYTSGDMLLGIINDMLDLSKIESGKLEILVERYEIASLVSDTAQLNMMRIGSKPIEFELVVDESIPTILLGDELRIKQVMNNILSNAFKYTAAGNVKLIIDAEPMEGGDTVMLVINISDTGQGMTKEQVDKLFDEYSRFNMETNRTTEGTGLGMSITQNLISMMDGLISVESEPGKGSTFTVRIPQVKVGDEVLGKEMAENLRQFKSSSRAQMRRAQITREPMPYGSVLLVDDVETNNFVTKGLLAPYGMKVDMADSGFEAIKKIEEGNEYDVIFMDHMMPKMDGIEATKIIRENGYDRPIVALTANAVSGQAGIFIRNGFDDFISKPIDVRQLNVVLNRLIRDKQPPEVIEAARLRARAMKEQGANKRLHPTISPRFAEIFARDANKSLAAMDSVMLKGGDYGENDIRTYTIHVHGIKSALASIGKADLAETALRLEVAARSGDTDTIATETPSFLDALRTLVRELKQEHEQKEESPIQTEDLPYLREKLQIIKSACEEYDEKTIEEAIEELRQKTWTQTTSEMLESIANHLLHSEFEEIATSTEKALKQR